MITRRLGNTWRDGIGGNDENTLLLLHGEDFTDSSQNNKSMSKTGTVTLSENGKFDKGLYFNNGALYCAPIILGTSDFTFDWWTKRTSNSSSLTYQRVFANNYNDNTSNGVYIDFQGKTNLLRICICGGAYGYCCDTNVLPLNTWIHCAFVRHGNTMNYYRDGTLTASAPTNVNIGYTGYNSYIGLSPIGDQGLVACYIDEFRISNVARWTSNFTPPDQPYS